MLVSVTLNKLRRITRDKFATIKELNTRYITTNKGHAPHL